MQKAIIDVATNVIKRVTTDENPFISPNEAVVVLSTNVDLSGGFKKVDPVSKEVSPASEAEIDQAGVDEQKVGLAKTEKVKALYDAIDAIVASKNVPDAVKAYFQILKDIR